MQNYNALDINITFTLSFSSSTNADIVVYNNPSVSSPGGIAGFPSSNGAPHKWNQIFGLRNSSVNVIEHVITHEIGHSVGLRHTDWFSRQSCGQNASEGVGYDGANHISGTPTGYDSTSLMLACFHSGVSGNFNNNDKIALETIYPSVMHYRWATRQGGFWNTQQWLSGDFNGDGKDDFAKVFNDGGLASIDVHLSSGSGFSFSRWATRQGGFWDAQKWLSGDFNGDGKDDFAKVFNDGGLASIDVHLSSGSGFSFSRWATRQGGFWNTQQWLSGDFNGDGKDDFAKVFNDGGLASIDVHLSSGSGFSFSRWATRQGGFWNTQQWLSGDFNGDGKDDFAKVFNDGGLASIDVHLSSGSGFSFSRWATRQGGFWNTQQWLSGDFNGDGKDDFAKVFNDGGLASIDVHLSGGSGFSFSRWATRQGGFWDAQKWLSGDFNGDGKDDFAKVFYDSGLASIDVHLSSGSGFGFNRLVTRQGGFWDTQKWLSGNFNGDGKDDFGKAFNDGGLASIDVHLLF